MLQVFKYRMNLQFFATDDGGQGGTGDPAPEQTGEQEQQTHTQQQQQSTVTGDQKTPEEKIFTQEDVNKIATKEARKAQEKLFKELGIEDFENAKEGFQKFKEWQESQKTEQEKQKEKLETLEQNYAKATDENESLKAQLSALKAGVNAESVEDVVVLAKKYVSDDVDMNQAIQKVLEKYPHFKAQQEDPGESEKPAPTFTTGQHQKQQQTELDKWFEAFGVKK